jgi:hypothetical protein
VSGLTILPKPLRTSQLHFGVMGIGFCWFAGERSILSCSTL